MRVDIPLTTRRPDVLDIPALGRFLRWRHARTAMGSVLFAIAAIMIWDGLWGPQLAPRNVATVLLWVQFRGLLVLALLAAGNVFCMACPFMLPRNLLRRFVHPTRRWPKRLRNKWTAVALIALFLFVYELFDLWASPWWTAWLIVGYFAAALAVDSVFAGASFCKYVCPVGQFNMVASLVSPLEVKVRQPDACASCRTKDCIAGRDDQRGCELYLFQPRKVGNMDCTFCLDCVHACPYDNVGIAPRLPAAELWSDPVRSGIGRFGRRGDLAALAAVFTFGALLNAFGMVSPVYAVKAWLAGVMGVRSEWPVLGVLFIGLLIVEPLVLLLAAAWTTRRLLGAQTALLSLVTRYSYTLVPLGVGIWLAHYGFHFLTGAWTIVPVVQTLAVDLGAPVLGAPRWDLGALVPARTLFPIQLGFIALGSAGSLLTAWEIAAQEAPATRWRAALPWMMLVLVLTAAALWLMLQPMEMRGTVLDG